MPQIIYDGSWEKKDKNINAAAVFALLIVGAIYFNVQSIITSIIAFVYMTVSGINLEGNYFERLNELLELLAPPLRIIVFISQYLLMFLPAIWIIKKWHTSKSVWEYIRLQRGSIVHILLAPVITLLFIPLGIVISNFFIDLLNIPDFYLEIGTIIFKANSLTEFIWLVIVISITPAICEEIFFRGYVQRTFERSINIHSVWITGIIFGLYHLQPLGLITLSLMGILFGYFYYVSKSIIPSMLAHFTNNFLAILLLYKFREFEETLNSMPIYWTLLSVIIGALLLIVYKRVNIKFSNN